MRRPVPLLLTLLAAAAASACAAPPTAPPGSADYRIADGYDARRPADVAVLPLEGGIPPGAAGAVREALRARLLARRYAPVRSREIDGRPGEFRRGGANAVLEVRVLSWADGRLHGDGSVRVTAEATLRAPGTGEPLYEARVEGMEIRAYRAPRSLEHRPEAMEQIAEETAELLLARLPLKGDG